MPDIDLIGEDDEGRAIQLLWSDAPVWVLQREADPGQWVVVDRFSEGLPVRALPFARWLLTVTGLHPDIVEEAVYALRDAHPGRFKDPWDDQVETGDVTEIHYSEVDHTERT